MLNKLINKIGFSEYGFKRYFKNTTWLFVDFGYTLLVSFFVGLAAARYLGPEFYGVMVYSLTLYAVTLGISGFGFDGIAARDALKDKDKTNIIFGTYFYTKLWSSFILFIISLFILNANFSGIKLLAGIFVLSSLILQPIGIINTYFNMRVESKFNSISKMIGTTISSILKISFIIFEFPVQFFAFAVLIDTFITVTMLLIFFLKRNNSFRNWKFDRTYFLYLFKSNWPMIIITILSAIYTKINIFMIGSIMSDKDIGIYGAAFKLTEIWYHIPALIITSLFPAIVAAKVNDGHEYNRRISSLLRLLVFPFIMIALITSLIGPFLINLLLGNSFNNSSYILVVLIWTLPFHAFYVVTMDYLIVENRVLKSMYRPLLALILLVTFNFIFYNIHKDVISFAYSLLFSHFISFFILDIVFADSRKLFLMKVDSIIFPIKYLFKITFKRKNK